MQVSLHSYSKVKVKRIVDIVSLIVHNHLVFKIGQELSIMLPCKFEDMFPYMSPDPVIMRQKQRVEESLKRLMNAEKILKAVM